MTIKHAVLPFLLCFCWSKGNSQPTQLQKDSISLTVDSAETVFLKNNLLLLAQKYNIDFSKALEIQARLYPNPNINFASTLYQTETKKFFPTGATGEVLSTLSQMILVAGKRNKALQMAKSNTQLAEYQFYDLLRTFKYTLRTDFYTIWYLLQTSKVYDREINALQQIVAAFEKERSKGYIAEKEIVRIKAQLYDLKSEYNDLINQINDTESELRLVLQVKNNFILPIVNDDQLMTLNPKAYPYTVLIDTAYAQRTDLRIAQINSTISRQNYSYQKALAVPDPLLQFNYDQQGSYIKRLTMMGGGIDIPIFNRNQGNINAAKVQMDINKVYEQSLQATVEEQIARAVLKATDQDKLLQSFDPAFEKDFERLKNEVFINYQKRNIGLLEFLDFYDSYKQQTINYNTIRLNRILSFEDINFYTGKTFFN